MLTDTHDPTFLETSPPPRGLPLVIVSDLAAVREFYVERLGCPTTFDIETYLQVQLTPFLDQGPELCFMVRQGGDGASGVVLSVPVADADAVQAALERAGVPIQEPAADMPWGWRSLFVKDPSGLVLDFFHVIQP